MRQSGDLSERVGLFKRTPNRQGGESRNSWTRIGEGDYPAEVRTQSDKAFAAGETRYMESVIFVSMRRLLTCELTDGLRLVWKGQPYEVAGVGPHPLWKGFIKLHCRAVKPEGTGV